MTVKKEEIQVRPEDLQPGDTILAISPNRLNFKVLRPMPEHQDKWDWHDDC